MPTVKFVKDDPAPAPKTIEKSVVPCCTICGRPMLGYQNRPNWDGAEFACTLCHHEHTIQELARILQIPLDKQNNTAKRARIAELKNLVVLLTSQQAKIELGIDTK